MSAYLSNKTEKTKHLLLNEVDLIRTHQKRIMRFLSKIDSFPWQQLTYLACTFFEFTYLNPIKFIWILWIEKNESTKASRSFNWPYGRKLFDIYELFH